MTIRDAYGSGRFGLSFELFPNTVRINVGNGRERNLVVLGELPFPDRTRAQRRCRQVLGGG